MQLNKLIEPLDIIEIQGESKDVEITDICYNSKDCSQDSLFVAIVGYETDGHKYIKDAIDNGAIAIVLEKFQKLDDHIIQIKIENSRHALADLSNKFFDSPSKELKTVGITATNGKTTTSFMTNTIFREAGINTGLVGTVETAYDDVAIPSILTTPESRDLQGYVRDMADRGITDLIMECSSHAGEMSRIRNMDYDVVTFNNISREHIDQHGNFENYFNIKSQLIKNAKEDAYVILNFDEDMLRPLADQTRGKVLKYSFKNNDYDFGIDNLDLSSAYPNFIFNINRDIEEKNIKAGSFEIQLGVAGISSVMNSVVAIIISLLRGIDIDIIQKALKEFPGVERRFQVIYDDEFLVIDDHYANARNIMVTMSTLKQMDYKNLHMVYAIRGNRGVNLNRESAEESVRWLHELGLDHIISTSSVETVTWKDEVAPEEKEIFDQVMMEGKIDVDHYDRLDDSIYAVLDEVEEGDLILLAGCQGMDPGGRVILEKITENMEESEKASIMKVLEGRAF